MEAVEAIVRLLPRIVARLSQVPTRWTASSSPNRFRALVLWSTAWACAWCCLLAIALPYTADQAILTEVGATAALVGLWLGAANARGSIEMRLITGVVVALGALLGMGFYGEVLHTIRINENELPASAFFLPAMATAITPLLLGFGHIRKRVAAALPVHTPRLEARVRRRRASSRWARS